MSETDRLEEIVDSSWEDFSSAPRAVLTLARSDCTFCAKWINELRAFLNQDVNWAHVRFGRINLDSPEATEFKKKSAEWLEMIDGIPFNIFYLDGTPRTSFAGAGVNRLEKRLRALEAPA